MKQIIKQLSLITACAVMAFGMMALPVSAHQGSDDDSPQDGTSDGSGNTRGQSGRGGNTLAVIAESESTDDDSSNNSGSLRKQAKQLLETKRKSGKEHSREQRQKACEQRQKSIDKRTTNFAAAAERHLGVFDKIFTRVQAFHDAKNLDVADYDTLVAAVTAKQAAAQTAVDELKALDVDLDCTQSDPASTVAEIKTAVAGARKALKEYRTSIKDLVTTLKGASTAQSTTTEGEGSEQ